MIWVRCPRCGARIGAGAGCTCKVPDASAYDRYQRDQQAREFYHSREWVALSQQIKEEIGVDVWLYMTTGQIVLPDQVHHIIPLKDDWSKRFDRDNLIPLSTASHATIEHEYRHNKQKIQRELQHYLKLYMQGAQ